MRLVGKKIRDQYNKDPDVFYLPVVFYGRFPDHHVFYHGLHPGEQGIFQTVQKQAQKRLGPLTQFI